MAEREGVSQSVDALLKRWGHLKPLVLALFLPLVIGLFGPSLIDTIFDLYLAAGLFLPGVILAWIVYEWLGRSQPLRKAFFSRICVLPSGMITGTNLQTLSTPYVTIALIAFNTLLFLALPYDAVRRGVFFPHGEWTFLEGAASFFTSAFLHGSPAHLIGNMFFLWVLGSGLEARLGSGVYFLLYLSGIITSKTFCLILLTLQALFIGPFERIWDFHSLGASGAIAGIMGIFAVRAYFARISITFPLFWIPFLSFPLRVHAGVLIGLYLCMDIAGGVEQFTAAAGTRVNYWSHVGGYLGGIALAYMLGFQNHGAYEASKLKAERIAETGLLKKEAVGIYEKILADDPANEKALNFFCSFHRFNAEKRAPYLARFLRVLERRDFQEALSLFEDNYPGFVPSAPGDLLLKFGLYYLREGDFAKASFCLENASEKDGPWQAKALYRLAEVYEEIDQPGLAAETLEKVMVLSPGTPIGLAAQKDLLKLKAPKDTEESKGRQKRHVLHIAYWLFPVPAYLSRVAL